MQQITTDLASQLTDLEKRPIVLPDWKWAPQIRAFFLSLATPLAAFIAFSHKRLRVAWEGRNSDGIL